MTKKLNRLRGSLEDYPDCKKCEAWQLKNTLNTLEFSMLSLN
jgi:hypothetical protein